MSIRVRPFKASDLSAFVPMEMLRPMEINDVELAKAIEDSGLSVTGIRDGKIVGCGGVHPIDDTCGELWVRLSQDCLSYKIETIRFIKGAFKVVEEAYPFKRLVTSAKCCFGKAVRLIEMLGFKRIEEVTFESEQWFTFSKEVC